MRSNIAFTCVSGSVPDAGVPTVTSALLASQRCDVLDELLELLGVLLLKRPVRRHRRGGVHERARDRGHAEPVADVGEVRAEGVAVLADLVAAEAAGRGHHLLAALEAPGRRLVDLGRRAGD